jgi:glycogen debranching enzyme
LFGFSLRPHPVPARKHWEPVMDLVERRLLTPVGLRSLAPFTPRGCIAQAWSIAEVLRCWVKTEPVSVAADAP